MTYTVKNGTWCKDNEKEYYSTTKTGLKAALKAGEIPAGTKVVVHEPQYHAGQLIQSLNPECPEGCFVPDGSAIDPVYEELIAVVGPNLPDMRECVLVMAGQNEHITTHNHDVFSAGEFKDDQAQLVEHDHAITDNGHTHAITDPGHSHDITDSGHSHEITDPGHYHTFTDDINSPWPGTGGGDWSAEGSGSGNIHKTDNGTGITTGITIDSAETGVSVDSAVTGITADATVTGITVNANSNNNVTRTKQFGVYYYIAF